MEAITAWLNMQAYMPHGHCYLWQPSLVGLHLTSDALIGLSYYTIPFTLYHFTRKRADLPYKWMFVLFAAFIFWCGTTHFINILTLWVPAYWISGSVKAMTAAASVLTAALLVPLIPKALLLRSPADFEAANQKLELEVGERARAETEIRRLNEDLERRVRERTAELEAANARLEAEVAERRRAEEALAAEKERLAVTLHSIADGVIAADTAARVVLMNRVASQLTGIEAKHAIGRPVREILPVPVEDNTVELILRDSSKSVERETAFTTDDGERMIAQSATPLRDRNSDVIGAVLVFRDVTERRRTQEQLARTQRLESIGVLAGGIAHDFNNILTAILGNITLARLSPDPNTSLLEEAETACMRARDLTQQLLTFAKGGVPIKTTTTLDALVLETVSFALRGSNVQGEVRVAPDLWAADVDAGQISQVLNNLVINSKEAMPNGGVLRVTAKNVEIAAGDVGPLAGEYVEIEVADQGGGIKQEDLQRIFDPFFSTKARGSGLGLASAHSIVQQHGGFIDVQSQVGKGSTFRVYLPANSNARGTHPDACTPGIARGHGRILVVDDEAPIRTLAERMLKLFGYEADCAEDGEEALRQFAAARTENRPFAAVIVDLTIPGGMGGRECVQALHRIDPQVPVIASSGYATDPVMSSPEKFGFAGVVPKPYRPETLSKVLAEVLSQARMAQS